MSPANKKHHFYLAVRHWHRRIGLFAALFVIVLLVTGILLNHTEDLKLDSRYVGSSALLDWYGIQAPAKPVSYAAGGHWITQLGERVYFDGHELLNDTGTLIGALTLDDRIIVAIEGRLLLFTAKGERLESLGGADGVPGGMRAIGTKADRLVVRASHGDYLTDKDGLRWEESEKEGDVHTPVEGVVWAEQAAAPAALQQLLAESYRGRGLSAERVLLDLHSGRILGWGGVWLVDAVAVLLMVLALSGVWMWLRLVRRG
jgi:hypothetical protein